MKSNEKNHKGERSSSQQVSDKDSQGKDKKSKLLADTIGKPVDKNDEKKRPSDDMGILDHNLSKVK